MLITLFLDRNNRMNSMQKRSEELKQQNTQLNETQHSIRTVYDNVKLIKSILYNIIIIDFHFLDCSFIRKT